VPFNEYFERGGGLNLSGNKTTKEKQTGNETRNKVYNLTQSFSRGRGGGIIKFLQIEKKLLPE